MIRKLQKDCQMLSQTVTGQAQKVKEQQSKIEELLSQLAKSKEELMVGQKEAESLRGQLSNGPGNNTISPVKVEVKEVIKYVDNPNCA